MKFAFWILLLTALDVAALTTAYYALPNTIKLRDGVKLQRLNSDFKSFAFTAGPKNKSYLPLSQIPRALWLSVLELEDAKFFQHNGFDVDEIVNAVSNSITRGKRLRGASTLTQQLAKNLYLSSERSFRRKIIEALITIKLELTLPKRKILEIYLNSIDWGHGIFGINDASLYYFKKKASDLNVRESVFLASIIPNPARFGKIEDDQLPKKFVRIQMMRALEGLYHSGEIKLEEYQKVMTAPYDFKTTYEFKIDDSTAF